MRWSSRWGNSAAVERILRPHVKRVAVANPKLVRAIAYARVKTDKVDAGTLAKLHAAGFLDEGTYSRRRQLAERAGVLAQIIRIKGRMKAILHANLIPPYKGYLFGKRGQHWLDSLPLPSQEREMLRRLIAERERVTKQLSEIDKVVAQQALDDPRALKLMTIPGVSSVVASIVLASIGDIARFPSPDKLSSYFGLTPRVRQSGEHPARHGRISKQGNRDARKMLVEAAWSAKSAPGPLRAFFNRTQKKHGGWGSQPSRRRASSQS
ncbi:transposase [Bradyrhizobium yuanmingense]